MASTCERMTPRQFLRLSNLIQERTGARIPQDRRRAVEARLRERFEALGVNDPDEYTAILYTRRDEFQLLLQRIRVGESAFFRGREELSRFERAALPRLIASRAGLRRLRIWSAACSRGEEPFTLAMLARRALGEDAPRWRIEVLGTDVSSLALERAAAGRYDADAVRDVPPDVLRRSFRREGGAYIVDPAIRTLVRFEVHDLRDRAGAERLGTWDAVFCRNILGYFDDRTRLGVLEMFQERLAADGCLFAGSPRAARRGPPERLAA